MGIGYLLGCLISILLWKIDRQNIYLNIANSFKKVIKNKVILQLFYASIIILICYLINQIRVEELVNAITAFIVIDISNTEKKNLRKKEKVHFYDSISIISRALVCGFVAPIFYILLFGNTAGLIYTFIYNTSLNEDLKLYKALNLILTMIPSLIVQIFIYIIYVTRNKKFSIDFKGDYFINIYTRPLLNIDIMAAYIESVNFYYYFNSNNTDYLKSYGDYRNKIDDMCIKDYLGITYSICMVTFIIFFAFIMSNS